MRRAVLALALLGGCGAPGAAPAARAPIGNTVDTPAATAAANGETGLCDAIAIGVGGAEFDFRDFIADPDDADENADVPANVALAGAVVTVNTGTTPDLTFVFKEGGLDAYEAKRDEFLGCPTFARGWQLETTERDDEHDLTFRNDDVDGRTLRVWMRVMSSGDLMICMHH